MKPIAITLGDPAGIGPEIIARAFRDAPQEMQGCFVAGDVATLRRAAGFIGGAGHPAMPVARIDTPADAAAVPPRCLPVLQVVPEGRPLVAMGRVHAAAGRMAADAVAWAARAALRGEVAALVTAPLHKEALAAAGVVHPGHTELLQAEAAAFHGVSVQAMPVRMMLANDELRTVLVSIHVSLREAIEAVQFDNVLQTIRLTARFLHGVVPPTQRAQPRIAVAGLNPHAGEGGLFGREEIEVIGPAIAAAQAEGIDAHGPFAPDTVFMRARAPGGDAATPPGEFDAVVAMYHDQGLIPVKYLGVEHGVNITLGLPLVRTSPDHGTAFDIAGTGLASAASLLAAVRMARRLARQVFE
ncbi:MAG: 4-hydroxythreonine-4-phosphate dehydrogenase PdxA [Burkholderiales bacterium]|nr:4-hydroxythreonine-4-phosphate dehydrogenase PdxA [Burkholderiales bacterium]